MVVTISRLKSKSGEYYIIDTSDNVKGRVIKDSLEWEYLLPQIGINNLRTYLNNGFIKCGESLLSLDECFPEANLYYKRSFPWHFTNFIDDHIQEIVRDNVPLTKEEVLKNINHVYYTGLGDIPKLENIFEEIDDFFDYSAPNLKSFIFDIYYDYAVKNGVKFYKQDPDIYPPIITHWKS